MVEVFAGVVSSTILFLVVVTHHSAQQGESVVYVKEQLGHGSIQITVDTYGHLIPGANRGAVNRLDDDAAMQPDATQAQPDPSLDDVDGGDEVELLGKSGEPKFRELEPARRVAAAGRVAAEGGVSALSETPTASDTICGIVFLWRGLLRR